MMTVNKDVILKSGYEKAAKVSLESYLTDAQLLSMYKEKMLAYGKDCGYTFTEEEVTTYIKEQMEDVDALQERATKPIDTRF